MNIARLMWRLHRWIHPSHNWGSDSRQGLYICHTCARYWREPTI